MNILIYSDLSDDLQIYLQNQLPANAAISFKSKLDQTQLKEAFGLSEIILGNPPADWFNEVPKKLLFWQLDSAGFDQYKNVKTDIPVANMGDFYARPCAETIVGGILAFYRYIHELIRFQDEKKWVRDDIRKKAELLGSKKVIILGAGTIGKWVRQLLLGFGCEIKMAARTNPLAQLKTLEEVLAELSETDLVINTLPGSAENYVTDTFFNSMKPQSLYASIGRGTTTDQNALIVALETGKIAGAVLDVTVDEPLMDNNKLWEMKNVILTQHTGGGVPEESMGKIKIFLKNLHNIINKAEIENQVELSRGY